MAFVLDSNILIQAKNEYYAFDICPGFWELLEREAAAGNLLSIEQVFDEIQDGKDELAEWVAGRREQVSEVSQWVMSADYKDAAKRDFLANADPFIIAFAKANGHIVASHEVHIEGERRKVKIPTVCSALGVECVRTFDMLRALGAKFVL